MSTMKSLPALVALCTMVAQSSAMSLPLDHHQSTPTYPDLDPIALVESSGLKMTTWARDGLVGHVPHARFAVGCASTALFGPASAHAARLMATETLSQHQAHVQISGSTSSIDDGVQLKIGSTSVAIVGKMIFSAIHRQRLQQQEFQCLVAMEATP